MKISILSLAADEFAKELEGRGYPPYRAKQILQWIFKGVKDFSLMENVPRKLRDELESDFEIGVLKIEDVQISKQDGTRKYLFALGDGNYIESVFMKYKYGNSVCVSSQAGCRMGCKFCASTIDGLARNLNAGEIMGQVLAIVGDTGEPVNHIVMMGTGEPFDNYENVKRFIKTANSKDGLGLSMRNITVSTCGLVPMIEVFGRDFPQVNLAISLHAVNDEMRSRMMPINKAYPMKALLEACAKYTKATGRRITFEYALVKGVNDGVAHAWELAARLGGMLCHVNLIPLNKVEETGLESCDKSAAIAFQRILETGGVPTTLRRELGDDIDGACGQLRLKASKK